MRRRPVAPDSAARAAELERAESTRPVPHILERANRSEGRDAKPRAEWRRLRGRSGSLAAEGMLPCGVVDAFVGMHTGTAAHLRIVRDDDEARCCCGRRRSVMQAGQMRNHLRVTDRFES